MQLPIACTLGADQAPGRAAEWSAANEHLRSREHRAGVIEATYGAAARPALERLVAAERDCCGHLGWELSESGDAVMLRIRGSEEELDVFET